MIRKPRSERVVKMAMQQRHWNHLEDGSEQEERDILMADQMKNGRDVDLPNTWINPELWGFICGYDPVAEVQKQYDTLAKKVAEHGQ